MESKFWFVTVVSGILIPIALNLIGFGIGWAIGLQELGLSSSEMLIEILFLPIPFVVFGVFLIYLTIVYHYRKFCNTFSKLYYILPIFLGIVGGVYLYFSIKDKKYKNIVGSLMWVSVINTVVIYVFNYLWVLL